MFYRSLSLIGQNHGRGLHPINRPHCPVNDMLRDGMHQTAVHTGLAPYHPNSIDGDEPLLADNKHGGYVQMPAPSKEPRCAPSRFPSMTTSIPRWLKPRQAFPGGATGVSARP